MRVALSPYHLTTREPPAMAALLLADHVVTMMPAPLADFGHADLHAAVRTLPRYLKFIESWTWSLPLWREGVLASVFEGQSVAEDVRDVCGMIDQDAELEPLRPLMRRSLFESDREYLDALAADLLKGGPDPGISVPLAAALDRFSARHGLLVLRSDAVSIAQRAEAQLGKREFAIAVPVLVQANGEQLLRAREILHAELARLRAAIDQASQARSAPSDEHESHHEAAMQLQHAASAYSARFDLHRSDLRASARDDERIIDGFVRLAAVSMPCDAVLRSSLAAVRVLAGAQTAPAGPASTLPVLHDPIRARRIITLVVKALGSSR